MEGMSSPRVDTFPSAEAEKGMSAVDDFSKTFPSTGADEGMSAVDDSFKTFPRKGTEKGMSAVDDFAKTFPSTGADEGMSAVDDLSKTSTGVEAGLYSGGLGLPSVGAGLSEDFSAAMVKKFATLIL
jgi:hypothetical protein